MSPTAYQLPPKMRATIAATCTNCTAVASAEPSAAFVSFQRSYVSLPPTQNVNSAPRSLTPACHFSGNNASIAVNAVTTATFTTFGDTSAQIPYP